MTDPHIVVSVEKNLEDLIPTYLANRAKEVATLRALHAAGNFEQLSGVGHRMKGVGEPYGFNKASSLGKLIQDHAKTGDQLSIEKCIDEYADYLSRVQIIYE